MEMIATCNVCVYHTTYNKWSISLFFICNITQRESKPFSLR